MYKRMGNLNVWIIVSLLIISPFSVLLAQASVDGSKHDFTFETGLTPSGVCSACHEWHPNMTWVRDLTEEETYFSQNSSPNYVLDPTLSCYDCHDNHDAVDNDPNYTLFINTTLGRYIPQDVAFDNNMSGNLLTYDSSPSDDEEGYYESSTSGHYIKTNATGLTNIETGDKLPCTDCHEPHDTEPTNEVFIKGSSEYPLGGKVVSNLNASTNTRTGTGTGRAICANCHAYNDTGTAVRFVDVNSNYGSTDMIIQTPGSVSQHESADSTPCTDCHSHSTPASYFTGISSHNTHLTADFGPNMASCTGAGGCHKEGDFSRFNDDLPLATTTVCNDCHSPNGAYDGVDDPTIGAKPNWMDGVYNGSILQVGKEEWCVGCHDDTPATIESVDAPDVGGDGTYGYFTTGHGEHGKVLCSDCHDVTSGHIDGDSRTYAFDSGYYGSSQSGVAYATGYRLEYVNGSVPLMIPANYGTTFNYNAQTMRDNAFRLCFDCHDSSKILDDPGNGIDSNFKASLPNPQRGYSYAWGSGADINEHVAHIMNYVGPFADSDWNTSTTGTGGMGGHDTLTACSSCHNVHGPAGTHGSTNEVMIRDGSLAGRTGYGFSYVVEDTGSGGYPMVTSSGATQSNSTGAIFRNNTVNMCGGSMCHGNPTPPSGSGYDATGSSWGTYLEYYRPHSDVFGYWLTPTSIECTNLSGASLLIDEITTTGNSFDAGDEQYVVFDLGSNYTVPSIKMYTDGSGSYTWDVYMGDNTGDPDCCNYSTGWGTLVLDNWTPTGSGWNETNLTTPMTGRYIKLMRDDAGDLAANSLREFLFDPPTATLTFELHSYADMHIYDPENRHTGMNYEIDEIENEIPGAVCNFSDVQTVSLPKLAVGEYRIILKGTGTGGYELMVTGESDAGVFTNETTAGNITEGEIHDATAAVNTTAITNITITLEDEPEPTIDAEDGVDNVTLDDLYPDIDEVDIDLLDPDTIDTTGMPDIAVHTAYMVNASGDGEYTLRFEDVENAELITTVYKINSEGEWIELPTVINGSTVEITMEAGDPPVIFAYPVPETPSNDDSNIAPPSRSGGGGGGASLPKDSDGDGVPDRQEQLEGTDPFNPDTDGDGLNDFEERVAGTDPVNPDTDGDGMIDGEDTDPAVMNFAQQVKGIIPDLSSTIFGSDSDEVPVAASPEEETPGFGGFAWIVVVVVVGYLVGRWKG